MVGNDHVRAWMLQKRVGVALHAQPQNPNGRQTVEAAEDAAVVWVEGRNNTNKPAKPTSTKCRLSKIIRSTYSMVAPQVNKQRRSGV